MGFLSDIENTVKQVAERPLIPGLFKQGKGKDDAKDGKKKPDAKDGKK